MSDLDAPVEASDPEVLLVAAYEAMRVLGREVRSLRAEVEALRAERAKR